MRLWYADLHVHLGSAAGVRPVKVTASPQLTLPGILAECALRKGIHMVGVVDAGTEGGLAELAALLEAGVLEPQEGGGLRYEGRVVLIPALEVELAAPPAVEPGGPAHFVAYLPDFDAIAGLAGALAGRVRNPRLSSQPCGLTPVQFAALVEGLGGFVVPAHVFTPYKGLLGSMADRIAAVLPDVAPETVPAVELGLSADTDMADRISELHRFAFLTNSDAHSLGRIGRECNALLLEAPTFAELRLALGGIQGRRIAANYGLHPLLGKYHQSRCPRCGAPLPGPRAPERCPRCGSPAARQGVGDRISALADLPPGVHPPGRPPYHRQIPLQFIPGLGPRARQRLLEAFGSEMAVLHEAAPGRLAAVVGERLAERIAAAREGRLALVPGGGGRYGRVNLT